MSFETFPTLEFPVPGLFNISFHWWTSRQIRIIFFGEQNDTKAFGSHNVLEKVFKKGLKMNVFAIISIWVLIVVAFGIYWHGLRISQKMTQCLSLLEKIAEGLKK